MLKDLKKIGRQVLFLPTTSENCRNGEGAFVRLKDGGILFAYTEFLKGTGQDEDVARIAGLVSYDEGETWGNKRILVSSGALNVMSVNFIRLKDGSLGLIHGEKYIDEKGVITNRKFFRVSRDEGITWSDGVLCYDREGYACMNHDRVIRLASGRIILPIAHHDDVGFDTKTRALGPGVVYFSVSDDDGKTWRTLPNPVRSPFKDAVQFQEPGLYQHEDGTLWLWCRTEYGSQFMAWSSDEGETWSDPEPSRFFTGPGSPLSVKRVEEYTVAVFNPVPAFCGQDRKTHPWGRTPLVCAVSTDDGRTFDKLFYFEDNLKDGYCYTALFPGKDYFLAAYYHSNGTGWCLDSTKMIKVSLDELV